MENNKGSAFGVVLFAGLLIVAAAFFLPWNRINWGKVTFGAPRTVTVTGQAKEDVRNEVAQFSAGVSSINDEKQVAVNEVNTKVAEIVAALKHFGIEEDDIKTQNINIYQNQEPVYEGERQKLQPGQWQVNNTVEVKLRDIDRTSALTDLLAGTGATNVWGPNFSLEDSGEAADELMEAAIKDAREKAEKIAKAAGVALGRVVTVSESGTSGYYPMAMDMARSEGLGGGGAPIEPGTSGVSKNVTVVFELE